MEFRQCIFRSYDGEPDAELGGISVYKYGHLIGVICLCCGNWVSAKRAIILEEFSGWLDLGSILVTATEMANEWEDEENEQ